MPVLRDPTQGNDVLVYLKADTMVEVLSRSPLWLCIQLPNYQKGYIQATLARPATEFEKRTIQTSTQTDVNRQTQTPLLTTQAGITSPMRRGPNFSLAFGLLMIAGTSCVLAVVVSSVVTNACPSGGSSCTSSQGPTIALGVVLFVVCGLFLLFGLIAGIASIVQSRRTR